MEREEEKKERRNSSKGSCKSCGSLRIVEDACLGIREAKKIKTTGYHAELCGKNGLHRSGRTRLSIITFAPEEKMMIHAD